MGGIAGIVSAERGRVDTPLLEAMLLAIEHRGPQDSGMFQDDRAGLGFVRQDSCRRTARQPLSNRARSLWIVFDGEFVNGSELRDTLSRRGVAFIGTSAAELALAAYAEFGEDCVRHFDGPWALAVWDGRNQRLFASRDRWGMRPFFYASPTREFAFASEIKSLVQHPGVSREIDPIALDQIFTLEAAIPPRTILRNVFELPPGHSLYWSEGALQVFRHWQLDFGAPPLAGDEREAEARLGALLADAAARPTQSAGPLGALVEGGLAALLSSEFARRAGGGPVNVWSLDFAESDAKTGALEQHSPEAPEPGLLRCAPSEIGKVFPEIVWHAETPLLDLNAASTFLMARAAREAGCSALVAGAGADELFGGSEIFAVAAIRRFWGRQVDSEFRPMLLKRLYPDLPWQASQPPPFWQAYFHVRTDELSNPLFSHLARWGQTSRLKKCFSGDLLAEIGEYDAREEARLRLPAGFVHWDALSQAQFLEAAWPLSSCVVSSRIDRMTMAHGLSTRMPFLDRAVVDFATTLPARLKLRGVRRAVLLKRLAERMLPPTTARPGGQSTPPSAAACFFGTPQAPLALDYLDAVLSRERIADAGLFDEVAVARLVHKARRGETMASQDQAALVGILSTQLVVDVLVRPPAGGPLTSVVRCPSSVAVCDVNADGDSEQTVDQQTTDN